MSSLLRELHLKRLNGLHLKRLKLMDEICDVLSDIPSTGLTALFGLSAYHIKKKLKMR